MRGSREGQVVMARADLVVARSSTYCPSGISCSVVTVTETAAET